MTATTLAEKRKAADLGELQLILLDRLRVAEWNARKTFDPAALDELTNSVREHGIQVPLLVRALGFGSWTTVADVERLQAGTALYEIVAGHRRFEAAKRVNLPEVPCIFREMTDAEAREIGLVDNLQREDVPALEEADAYAELQQTLGTAAAIAQRVGKDVAYVTKRLQLVSLGKWPRKALAERLITIDHALLLARLGEDEQDANLKWALNPNEGSKKSVEDVIAYRVKDLANGKQHRYGWSEPESVLSLKYHIEQNVGRKLSRAPWDLADAHLTEAGACTGCPSNTRDNTALFGDLSIDEATCENGRCFEQKRATFVEIQLGSAGAGTASAAVRISWKDSSAAPRFVKETGEVNLRQTFRHGQWVEAKKGSCEHVCAGVTVDWSDDNRYGFGPSSARLRKPGERILVCVTPKCKAHPKAWEKAAKSGGGTKFDAKAYEAEQQRKREAAIAESKLRVAAASAALDKVTKLPEAALRAVLLESRHVNRQEHGALVPGLRKILATAPIDSPQFAKAVAAISIEAVRAWDHHEVSAWRPQFLASLKVLGYDASKHWQKPKAEKKPAAKKAAAKPAKKAAKKGGRK